MNQQNLRHLCELALIRSIPDMITGLKPSRIKGLFAKLQREVDKDLGNLPAASKLDMIRAGEIMTAFMKSAGWYEKAKHPATTVSFALGMIESSDFRFRPGIVKKLNEITAHFEAGGHLPAGSCWGGSLAAEKWNGMFNN